MDRLVKLAALHLASLKAMTLVHQHSHWLSKGPNFYGSHLLFQRIYESAQENLDGAAEKFVATFGDEVLDWSTQTDLLGKVLSKMGSFERDPFTMSLEMEKQFLNLNKALEEELENTDKLTQGLANFIQGVADNRETAIYLLQQTLKTKKETK